VAVRFAVRCRRRVIGSFFWGRGIAGEGGDAVAVKPGYCTCTSPVTHASAVRRIEQRINRALDVLILARAGGKKAAFDQGPDGGLAHPDTHAAGAVLLAVAVAWCPDGAGGG
jgi:hypothetical protein